MSILGVAFMEMVSDAAGAAEPKEKFMSLTTTLIATASRSSTTRSAMSAWRTTPVLGAAAVIIGVAAVLHTTGVSFEGRHSGRPPGEFPLSPEHPGLPPHEPAGWLRRRLRQTDPLGQGHYDSVRSRT